MVHNGRGSALAMMCKHLLLSGWFHFSVKPISDSTMPWISASSIRGGSRIIRRGVGATFRVGFGVMELGVWAPRSLRTLWLNSFNQQFSPIVLTRIPVSKFCISFHFIYLTTDCYQCKTTKHTWNYLAFRPFPLLSLLVLFSCPHFLP